MLIHIDPHGGTPIYRQVMDQVSALVMTGQLASGEQLESVAALSGRLRVNPMTISKAYSQLVHDGLLVRRPGIGLFVREFKPRERDEARLALLNESMEKTAVLANQLGVEEGEAIALFAKHLKSTKP
jgi:GntR family transcriptional regulator